MLIEEFEKLTRLRPTAEHYAEIEAAYMGLPGKVTKDRFCRIWLNEDGINDLYWRTVNELRSVREQRAREHEEKDAELSEALRRVDALSSQLKEAQEKLLRVQSVFN